MIQKNIIFGVAGLVIGLIIGFLAANSINRNSLQEAPIQPQPNAALLNPQIQNALVKEQPATQGAMMPDIAETLDKAKNAPDDFNAQIEAGDLYARIKGLDKAVEFYEKAHQIKPGDYETIVKIGNTYFDFRKYEQAEKWYEQALAKKAYDINVRTDLGITFVERENPDLDRAVKEFQTSLQTDPTHEPTLYNLGVAYFKKGNSEEANKILAQLEATNPTGQLPTRLRQIINVNK